MRTVLGIPAVLSMFILPASAIAVRAQPLVEVRVEAHAGYVGFNDLEEDLDWNNMVVVNNDMVGFWVVLPSGQRAFRCRNMWYDNSYDEWRYGPWGYDYSLSYNPFNGIRFHVFMENYYPRYHERYFYRDNGSYFRYNDNRNASIMERNQPPIRREKQVVRQINPVHDRQQATVITHGSSQPVRTDGGNRIDRMDRPAPGPTVATQSRVVERSSAATRVQPSSNGTRASRTEPRREMQRR